MSEENFRLLMKNLRSPIFCCYCLFFLGRAFAELSFSDGTLNKFISARFFAF